MNPSTHQVFQTDKPTRWQRFKWSSRFITGVMFLLVSVVVVALWLHRDPDMPLKEAYKKVMVEGKPLLQESKITKEYKGMRQYISETKPHLHGNYLPQDSSRRSLFQVLGFNNADTSWNRFPCGIRSAFYVAWDPQSYFSLKRSITKLNLVLPEWFFIDPIADTVFASVDARGFELMRNSGVKIMPMLSNNFNGKFRPEAISRIFKDDQKRKRLINDVLNQCVKNKFVGINVDLEEVKEDGDEPMIEFMHELSQAFHARGLLVTQDVSPFNSDYNYKALSDYTDYMFLMAYDEYSEDSDPGPISSQRWIEAAVDLVAKEIPSHKIILGMAGYGYDWPTAAGEDATLTYQEALTRANESEADIHFDNDTYNLRYSYGDDSDKVHEVYFTDAATNFNTLRFATEYGLAGTALWRLGSEDGRLWDFYDKDMTKSALAHFNFSDFNKVERSNDVDYIGEGEVLDVLGTPKEGHITPTFDTAEMLISEERYDSLPSMFVVKKYGKTKPKELVLTFDDGPDADYTPRVLDILSKYHVPAAFFLVGLQAESNLPLVKRIYREGHEIGNHTFTHPNMAEVSLRRAKMEMRLTRLLIEAITGHSTIMFRAPYNADSEPETMQELIPVANARDENYLDIGESVDPEDWQPGITADSIFARTVAAVATGRGNIILLHDAGGDDRSATVEALPRIIEYFQQRGYTFTNISNILHKTKDEVMPPVATGSGYYLLQMNLLLAEIGYWCGHFLFSMFIVFIFLGMARLVFMLVLVIRERKRSKNVQYAIYGDAATPLVSVIVPAYNEELNAVSSLQNLLLQNYPNFNVVFIDDGSKDTTYEKVMAAFEANPRVQVFTKPNGGKASALNYGIMQTDAPYVVCIDADTKLYPDAVSQLMKHFTSSSPSPQAERSKPVGAVAGNVKVGNEVNMLTRWQAIEYISSQNFDRQAFANINAITVVPGAIGGFLKKALDDAGGFTTDTLAEDCDVTIRILKAGYLVENENKAVAMTEAPESLPQFLKQRTRWSFGVMQTFWKHRDALFNVRYGSLGWCAMPNILLFQFIIPLFSPLADIFMIIGLLTGNAGRIGKYYLIFMLVDSAIALMAFLFEKERISKLAWLIPQRLAYRWIMYIVLFRSLRKAVKGELQHWGVLKRTGNVKNFEEAV
ncbi:MAG: polysaccharide deacetylase family protein [Chitinophagaceae bacterium]